MTEKKVYSVGLLAYGVSGRIFHAPFVSAHEGFKLHGAVERNPSKRRIQNDYSENVKSYQSVDELLADKEIDLVVVNTPSETHFEFARAALEAGKNVLVEKPVCANCSETRELIALAKNLKLRFFPYHQLRYTTDFLSLKSAVKCKAVGDIVELHYRWDRYRLGLNAKAWKEDEKKTTSGLTYDLAPHLLDQIILLFGEPKEVLKTVSCLRPNSKVS